MSITVHYHAQLRRAAGRPAEELDAEPGLTVGALLRRLAQRHGEALGALLLDARGGMPRSLLVFIGEQAADPSDPVCDGDEVTILTPMAGG